jgi:hypothetical protein
VLYLSTLIDASKPLSMNIFFYLVGALSLVLLADDINLVMKLRKMKDGIAIFQGGLEGWVFVTWGTTFALSSMGLVCSFYLYCNSDDITIPTIIFVILHILLMLFNYTVIRYFRAWVACCIASLALVYILLFAYTLHTYPLNEPSVHPSGLLVATHIGNAACVFHSTVLDICVWHGGWLNALWEYDDEDPDFV